MKKGEPIQVWIDGACEPVNPGGTAAFAGIIRIGGIGGKHILKGIVGSGYGMSNNVAEYAALRDALRVLLELEAQNSEITVFSDSKLLVNQMTGKYRVRGGFYYSYYLEATALASKFTHLSFKWIPRSENTQADGLTKQALREKGVQIRYE